MDISNQEELLQAIRYGYEYHQNSQFPLQGFDEACRQNAISWITTVFQPLPPTNTVTMEEGKIYSIKFGESTQLIVRFKSEDVCKYNFFDHLNYWNGFERFFSIGGGNYCVKYGITEIRRATQAEIQSLLKFEIENDCI